MKKALFSLLMVAAFMPFAMAQTSNHLETVSTDVSACQTYTWNVNNQTYTTSTVATYLNATGDTLFVLNLTINNPYSSSETYVCDMCSYTWRDTTYYNSGILTQTVPANAALGTCDSVFQLLLTLSSSEINSTSINTCGDYEWNDSTYTVSGTYRDTTATFSPDSLAICNHIDELVLNIVDTMYVSESVEHCGTYNWYNEDYTTTGTYLHDVMDTLSGCDTLHTLNLTIVVDTAGREIDSACASKTWRGTAYTASGIYGINDTNSTTGCVTYRSIELTIKTPRTPEKDTAMVGCNSAIFTVSSLAGSTTKRFYEDATFDTVLHDLRWNKCYDSTIHLNVTIHKSGYDTTYVNACDSFYWKLNKKTYYKTPATAPTYAFTTDTFGCDSIMTLILNLKPSPVITSIDGEWHLHAGDTAVLTANCTEGSTYKWTYGTNGTSTDETLIIPNVSGNIDVALEATLTYSNDFTCHDTSWITIVTFEGIDQAEDANITLYPNPTVGQINIESAEAIREIAIFNTIGQKVITNCNLGNQNVMNLSHLNNGTYTMRITLQNGKTIVRKFIVTK